MPCFDGTSAKNADISILSNFLTIFSIFSRYREILPSTIYMPNFGSIGPFEQKLRGGGRICPAIPICKKPDLFRVNSRLFSGIDQTSTGFFEHPILKQGENYTLSQHRFLFCSFAWSKDVLFMCNKAWILN